MPVKMDDLTERDRLALKVVSLARALVLADNHFLSAAIGRLRVVPGAFDMPFATDGERLGIDSSKVCQAYAQSGNPPKHDFLHVVLHCVFLHPFVGSSVDSCLWNLACDIAVERAVAEVCGPRSGERGEGLQRALCAVEEHLGRQASAEKIYRALRAGAWAEDVVTWSALFAVDDHGQWGVQGEPATLLARAGSSAADSNSDDDEGQHAGLADGEGPANVQAAAEGWRRVAKSLAVDLQSYSGSRGSQLASFVGDLEEAGRNRVDYAEFLRQFATPGEVTKVSQDEFDYVFYTYGLRRYGNMPLIEPLEYREQKLVREFVIAIDTSGSVWGEAVRWFVETTFDMLKSSESFFETVRVHVIQCDSRIQSDDEIGELSQLETWGAKMRVRGGGGTDFRPVFEYVDGLVEDGTFENLGGLVYFTDGKGTYPDWTPDYKTAFALYGEGCREDDVPPWAAVVILDDDSLECARHVR